jgi:membrane-associated phospholipid phosphatase
MGNMLPPPLAGPDSDGPVFGGLATPDASATPGGIAGLPSDSAHAEPPGGWFSERGRLYGEFCKAKCKITADYRNFYSWPTMFGLALGFGGGAILANTSLDQDYRNWYQDDVRSSDTDDFARSCKVFGEGQIFIPACAGLAVLNVWCQDVPLLGVAGDFGDRTTRAFLVGAPPMLLMQFVTGASRPEEAAYRSHWRPFEDNNGVSGHAFMGAVPFITAAQMCENPLLKGGFYFCSTLAGWSRVNDDAHYLSQVCLGWWMAYLACQSVSQTNFEERLVAVTPLVTPEMTGVGIIIRR